MAACHLLTPSRCCTADSQETHLDPLCRPPPPAAERGVATRLVCRERRGLQRVPLQGTHLPLWSFWRRVSLTLQAVVHFGWAEDGSLQVGTRFDEILTRIYIYSLPFKSWNAVPLEVKRRSTCAAQKCYFHWVEVERQIVADSSNTHAGKPCSIT